MIVVCGGAIGSKTEMKSRRGFRKALLFELPSYVARGVSIYLLSNHIPTQIEEQQEDET